MPSLMWADPEAYQDETELEELAVGRYDTGTLGVEHVDFAKAVKSKRSMEKKL